MGIGDKIKELEAEYARTQKNKSTEKHLMLLRARLARLRAQLEEESRGGGGAKGEGFDVMKSGDARVAMIGYPSVGKSSLLSIVTETASRAEAWEFTTLDCIPGVLRMRGANIQLLDLPGIIEGAAQGKGRGKQVISVARTADCVLMMLDASKGDVQREKLERELETMGIRLNKRRPDIVITRKERGGVSVSSTCTLSRAHEETVRTILSDYRIHNAEVLFREDCSLEDFIDVLQGERIRYIPCIYVYNKIDTVTVEEVDQLARQPHSIVASCHDRLNIDEIKESIWRSLDLVRVYTKRRGKAVEHVCHAIHRTMASSLKYALVWGTSVKHMPQKVGLSHMFDDEDVVQLALRK